MGELPTLFWIFFARVFPTSAYSENFSAASFAFLSWSGEPTNSLKCLTIIFSQSAPLGPLPPRPPKSPVFRTSVNLNDGVVSKFLFGISSLVFAFLIETNNGSSDFTLGNFLPFLSTSSPFIARDTNLFWLSLLKMSTFFYWAS